MITTARDVAESNLSWAISHHRHVIEKRAGVRSDVFGTIDVDRAERDFHIAAALLIIMAYGSHRVRDEAKRLRARLVARGS